ncbi:MAG TPA: response regulator [Hymenobacter sp.]|uniref:response regulator n=1 Tax=Hymenobacter sp. TaxID=1898978 RepID=UPI002D7FAA19|nr:response regulator [Hymenobacter sp.]HET9506226.1 response regulator [Hymenobacter sp.]
MQKLASVLLVDDDPTTNFLHEQLLLSLGVTEECLVAENGAEALILLADTQADKAAACPDLVLLDVHMPVMDGIDFLEAYMQPPQRPPVVIILTTSVHARDQARMAGLPVADWINKPLTRAKVNDILQRHFQRQLPPEEAD